jgi:hypothetical protein
VLVSGYPENRRSEDQDDHEQNGPRIDTSVVLADFHGIAHVLPLSCFYDGVADWPDQNAACWV